MEEGRRSNFLSIPFCLLSANLDLERKFSLRCAQFADRIRTSRIGGNAMRKSPWMLLLFVLIGGLLGGILGEILRVMAPPEGTIQRIFTTALTPGIEPPFVVNLILLKVTIGFTLKMNLLTFLGMFLGVYLYKQV